MFTSHKSFLEFCILYFAILNCCSKFYCILPNINPVKLVQEEQNQTHNLDSISTTVNVEVKPVPSPGEQHMGGSGAHVFV